MTNGEKIKQIFPGLQIDEGELEVYMWTTTHDAIDMPLEWWEAEYKEPTTKNDLTGDCISRQEVIDLAEWFDLNKQHFCVANLIDEVENMPSVTPQEPQSFKWCTDCKEYDQEKHCCHRYSKVIRNTVEEMKQEPKTGHWKEVYAETDYRNGWIEFSCENCEYQHGLESGEYGWSYGDPIPWKYCPICGAKMVEPQESENV